MAELPEAVVEEAARLTRLARRAVEPAEAEAYRAERDGLVEAHGFVARVRTDDEVLVCHPAVWIAAGVVEPDRIDDLDRAVERPLAGTGDGTDWATVEAYNREVVAAVEADHGPDHAATVEAFADFMGNHYARRIETAGDRECREFLEDYLRRNAWPTDEQLEVAEESLRLVFEAAGAAPPPGLDKPAREAEHSDPSAVDER